MNCCLTKIVTRSIFVVQEMQELKTIEEAELLFLKHGENIVDLIGSEVDRIEKQLKVS